MPGPIYPFFGTLLQKSAKSPTVAGFPPTCDEMHHTRMGALETLVALENLQTSRAHGMKIHLESGVGSELRMPDNTLVHEDLVE